MACITVDSMAWGITMDCSGLYYCGWFGLGYYHEL